jgi:CheY-like chemotaxis protein
MRRIKQLLIIDDDSASRRLLIEAVQELFITKHIISCSTAFRALTYIKTHCMPTLTNPNIFCPELILLDISMPVIDGYGFLAELHRLEGLRHRNTSVLFVSGLPYEKEKHKVELFPVLGYVEKPVTVESLRCTLKNIVSN